MNPSPLNKPARRLLGGLLAAALLSGISIQAATAAHDFQAPLQLGPLHGQGAWTYPGGPLPQEEARIAPGGLYWVGADNGIIPGGSQYLRTRASLDDLGKMNTFASLGSLSFEGTTYVRFLLRMDERPANVFGSDPYEFFFGLADSAGGPWDAYAGLKHPVAGSDPTGVETTNSDGILPNAKVVLNETLLVVARFKANEAGELTGIAVWINPSADDAESPDHSIAFAEPGVHMGGQTNFNVRAQNMPVAVDNLVFASSWDAVVPPAYDGTLRPPVVLLPPASPEGEIGEIVEMRALLWDHPDNTVTGYQWRYNRTIDIPTAWGGDTHPLAFIVGTGVQTTTDPVTLGINSTLGLRLTNETGTTVTPDVRIREKEIPEPPVFTSQPLSREIMDGDFLELSVVVYSLLDVTYQWFHDDEPIAGATDARLRIFGVTEDHAGAYYAEATNELGTTRSDDALVRYDDDPFPEDARVVRLTRVANLGPNIAAAGQADDQTGPDLSPHDPAEEPPTVASMSVADFSARIGQAFDEGRGGVFDFNPENTQMISGRPRTEAELEEEKVLGIQRLILDLGGTEIGVTPIVRNTGSFAEGFRGRDVPAPPVFLYPTGFVPRGNDSSEWEFTMAWISTPQTRAQGDSTAYPVLASSPDHALFAGSYIKLEFDRADKVDLVGFVFVNREYFQTHRSTKAFPDKPNIRATARFSDGSETIELISTGTTAQGDAVPGRGYNTFFGFESPGEAFYLENIDVWALGNNWRLYFSIDDLAVAVAEVEAIETPVTGIAVSPASFALTVGDTRQLSADVLPANATNKTVSWASDNTTVATVTGTGLVTAVGSGSATLTATTEDGGFSATTQVTVESAMVFFPDAIGATATGNAGEYASDWFGVFLASETDSGWIRHEGIGWLYAALAANADALWFGSVELDGWIYTDASIFPFIWREDGSDWIYYLLDAEGIGYQFDYLTNEWSAIRLVPG